jgi:hypothetical protein
MTFVTSHPGRQSLEARAPSACVCDMEGSCFCPDLERALRDNSGVGQTLSADEREWCLQEIASIEGHSRADFDGAPDGMVAHGVLCAWLDYARDKGLI